MSLPLVPLKRIAESEFEVLLENGETQKWFPVVMLYFCNITEAGDISEGQHNGGTQCPCVRCHNTYKNKVIGTSVDRTLNSEV